jgi:hypothetical protein
MSLTYSEHLTAIDELRAQHARISELEEQLAATQRDLIQARNSEKAVRLDERQKAAAMITQAMSDGALSKSAPDSSMHWLSDFWLKGFHYAGAQRNLERAAEHRRRLSNDLDRVLEDIRPAIEHVLANREEFGAEIGHRVAPIISDYFLKAYAAAPAPLTAMDGRELTHFTVTATKRLKNGTKLEISTNEQASAYHLKVSGNEDTGEAFAESLCLREGTFGEMLAIIAELTGLTLPGGIKIELDGKALVLRAPEVLMIGGSAE